MCRANWGIQRGLPVPKAAPGFIRMLMASWSEMSASLGTIHMLGETWMAWKLSSMVLTQSLQAAGIKQRMRAMTNKHIQHG